MIGIPQQYSTLSDALPKAVLVPGKHIGPNTKLTTDTTITLGETAPVVFFLHRACQLDLRWPQ